MVRDPRIIPEEGRDSRSMIRREGPSLLVAANFISSHGRVPLEFVF